jgi:hypothetical protein
VRYRHVTEIERLTRAAKNYRELAGFAEEGHMRACLLELAAECDDQCGCRSGDSGDLLILSSSLEIGRPAIAYLH